METLLVTEARARFRLILRDIRRISLDGEDFSRSQSNVFHALRLRDSRMSLEVMSKEVLSSFPPDRRGSVRFYHLMSSLRQNVTQTLRFFDELFYNSWQAHESLKGRIGSLVKALQSLDEVFGVWEDRGKAQESLEETLTCDVCGLTFSVKGALSLHLIREHPEDAGSSSIKDLIFGLFQEKGVSEVSFSDTIELVKIVAPTSAWKQSHLYYWKNIWRREHGY